MLVLRREKKAVEHGRIADLPRYLCAGICSSSTTPGSLPRACSASASRVAAPSNAC